MKKLFILTLLIFTVCSCGKVPMNGKLDGMWQLMQIEHADGTVNNIKESRLYYCIQLELLGLQSAGHIEFLGRFAYTEDSLFVNDFRLNSDNTMLAIPEQLSPYGINETAERFGIEQLTSDKMVLKSNTATLSFRKF